LKLMVHIGYSGCWQTACFFGMRWSWCVKGEYYTLYQSLIQYLVMEMNLVYDLKGM
jgi:hypothetical protein